MAAVKSEVTAAYLKQSRTALIGIFILSIVATMSFARDFLLPVFFAFFIALTFRPTIRALSRRNIPAWASATGFALILVFAVLVSGYLSSGPIAGWIADAPQIQRTFMEKLRTIRSSMNGVADLTEQIKEAASPDPGAQVQEVVVKESGIPGLLSLLAGYPAQFLITLSGSLVIAVFLMASGDLFYEKLIHVLPTLSDKKTALRIVYDVEKEVSFYLLTVVLINAGVGISVGISFYFVGLPTPILWAFLAFALNFIPYIGPVTGMLVSTLVSVVVFDTLSYALLAPLCYLIVIGIETQLVSPFVLSRRLQINSVAILIALAFWAWIWGLGGVILAIPLLVTFRVFCSHLPSLAGIGEFLGQTSSDAAAAEKIETPPAIPATKSPAAREGRRRGTVSS